MKLSQAISISAEQIKNIIFDWGGVITNIDIGRSDKAFKQLGLKDFGKYYYMADKVELYRLFEEGRLSAATFRDGIRKLLSRPASDEEIDLAWYAMIGDTPSERWTLLRDIKKYYRTFLLSNTSIIHVERFFEFLYQRYGIRGYRHLFEKVYFSYETGIRKPDPRAFRQVLDENGLIPEETLLIDDSQKNIDVAGELGIRTYHLQPPLTLTKLFENGQD